MAGGDGLIPALSDPPSSANPDVAAAADVAGAIELRDLKAEILDLLAQLKFAHGSLPRASPPAAPAVSSPEVRNDSSDSPVISAVPSLLPLHASVASSLPNSVAPSTQHPVSPSPPPIVVQSHDIPRFSGADGLSTMRWLTAFARITQTPLTSTSPLSDAVQCILTTALKGYALETYLDLSEDASMADVASALLHDFPEPPLKRVEADFDNLKQTSSVVHHAREFQRLYKKVQQLDPLYRLSPSRLAEKFRMSLHPALSDALFIYNYTEYDKMFEMAIHLEPKYPIAAVNAIEVGGAQPLVCHYCDDRTR